MEPCPICQEEIELKRNRISESFIVKCSTCGKYQITEEALQDFPQRLSPRTRANASGWLRENEGSLITLDNTYRLLNQKTPSFHERADKLLLFLERQTEYAGQAIEYDASWINVCWCVNKSEMDEVLNFLRRSERLKSSQDLFTSYKITPDGWKHLEEVKKINIGSQQGFVAMWFDDRMEKIYDKVIAPAIEDAGYKPHRVDKGEHNNKIDDEIIAEIRRSRFVIADFTGQRGGVYYEAGFAKGLGLEVIWTCREDELEKLHFDIRQYNCIVWNPDDLDEFRKKISYRIESVLGQGAHKRKLMGV